jgi:hypothetical protein
MSDRLFFAVARHLYATLDSPDISRRRFMQLLLASGGVLALAVVLPRRVRRAPRIPARAFLAPRGRKRRTRLDAFLHSRGIKPVQLARTTGYSRQHLLRLRRGLMVPSQRCAARLVLALRALTGETVTLYTVFAPHVVRALGGDAWVTLVALHAFVDGPLLTVPFFTAIRRVSASSEGAP